MKLKTFGIYFLIMAVLFGLILLPTLLPVQSQTQKQSNVQANDAQSHSATATRIFNNNIIIAAVALIPYVGWGYLGYVMWETGKVIASYNQPWWWIFNNPFAWIELSIYSYMVLQSWKLFGLLKQNKLSDWFHSGGYFKVKVIKTIAYTMIVAIVVLLLSAILEYWVIASVTI